MQRTVPSYKLSASVFIKCRSRGRRSFGLSLSLVHRIRCSSTFVFGCDRHPKACTSSRLPSGIPRRIGLAHLTRVVSLRARLSERSGLGSRKGVIRILIRNFDGHSHLRLSNHARRGGVIMFSGGSTRVKRVMGIGVLSDSDTALGKRVL